MTTTEVIAFLATIAGVVLAAYNQWLTWPCQLAASVLYTVLFINAQLFGLSVLQFSYALMSLYGGWRWRGHPRAVLPITQVHPKQWLYLGGGGLLVSVAVVMVQQRFLSNDVPVFDSLILVFGLFAQCLQVQRKLENWGIWVVLDLITAGLCWYKSLYLTALLFFILSVFSVYGWYRWSRLKAV